MVIILKKPNKRKQNKIKIFIKTYFYIYICWERVNDNLYPKTDKVLKLCKKNDKGKQKQTNKIVYKPDKS